MSRPTTRSARSVTPIPIPIAAPVERPLLLEACVTVCVEVAGLVGELVAWPLTDDGVVEAMMGNVLVATVVGGNELVGAAADAVEAAANADVATADAVEAAAKAVEAAAVRVVCCGVGVGAGLKLETSDDCGVLRLMMGRLMVKGGLQSMNWSSTPDTMRSA